MNPLIVCNLATLTIALLYYVWRDACLARLRKVQVQHERVALMLWSVANRCN